MSHELRVFELLYNSDSCEGRGPMVVGARFSKREDAVEVCKDKRWSSLHGVMGCACNPSYDVREVDYAIFDSADEFWNYPAHKEAMRKAALAKLTDDEKRLLGLSDS